MASEKTVARKSAPSKSSRDARIAAVRSALNAYFLGSASPVKHFWNTANPSLGNKSPEGLVKAGKLRTVEHYVHDLRKHVRSVRAEFDNKPTEGSFWAFEGKIQNVPGKLKETPADHHLIVIEFPDPESYYTHAPVYREMFKMLPEIMRRLKRRQNLLYARYFHSLTANLPIAIPKLRARCSSEILAQFVEGDNQ